MNNLTDEDRVKIADAIRDKIEEMDDGDVVDLMNDFWQKFPAFDEEDEMNDEQLIWWQTHVLKDSVAIDEPFDYNKAYDRAMGII